MCVGGVGVVWVCVCVSTCRLRSFHYTIAVTVSYISNRPIDCI